MVDCDIKFDDSRQAPPQLLPEKQDDGIHLRLGMTLQVLHVNTVFRVEKGEKGAVCRPRVRALTGRKQTPSP